MYYSKIIDNDTINCLSGITVSLFTSGCPHHCKGCFNAKTWNPKNGEQIEVDRLVKIIKEKISAYGVDRNFSVLGGEPLVGYNIKNTSVIISEIRKEFPNIKIYLWSGYTLSEIKKMKESKNILKNINYLIDGRFEENKKDTNLVLRGSSNQKVYENINGEMKELHI